MRIGIDARFYGSLGKGLGRYVSELIAHLEKIDRRNEYVIFLRRGNWNEYEPHNQNFKKVLAEFPWYSWKEQIIFPFFLRRHRLDLMHFTHFNVPLLYRDPFVVTVHDLILLKHPTQRASTLGPLLYRLKHLAYRIVIGNALRKAKYIITVSRTTKGDILDAFPVTRQKQILVTYGACADAFRKNEELRESIPERVAALGTPFMLYVGNAYPHKNLERLITSFARFRERGHADWKMVFVGAPDYFYGRLEREMRERGLDRNVVFFGHASDNELSAIYRRATFYVFPSLCEGFGLPPLEAMCNGLPVASSNRSCMPEVLGEAALYFNPDVEESVAHAMERLADKTELRESLARKGFERAARYDWETAARQTLEIYQRK